MKYTHIKFKDTQKYYEVEGKPLVINKIKTGRWLLTDQEGNVLLSATSQKACVAAAEEYMVAQVTKNINLHKLRFGKRIDEATIEKYSHIVWGDVYHRENIYMYDGHYWMADIVHTTTGKVVKNLRMDYFLNYMRTPAGTHNFDDVRAQLKLKKVA